MEKLPFLYNDGAFGKVLDSLNSLFSLFKKYHKNTNTWQAADTLSMPRDPRHIEGNWATWRKISDFMGKVTS